SGSVVVALITSVLVLVGCSAPPTAAPTGSAGATTMVSEETADVPPTTVAAAVYKPATADGPAENVPVPVLPGAATEFTREGLIAFTNYWYSTLGYAYETGLTAP